MGIKDIYFKLEDAYYKVLDKINAAIPIYKIIEPIDKVVPSFALLILIVAALVGFFVVLPLLQFPQQAQYTNLELEITNEMGIPLSGIEVRIVQDGNIQKKQSSPLGKISINVISGGRAELYVEKSGFRKYKQSITPIGAEFPYTVKLITEIIIGREKTITFVGSDNRKLSGVKITAEFSCSTPGVEP